MEQIPIPSPEPPKQEQEWGELLKDYLEKLQTISASTLELTPEEKRNKLNSGRRNWYDFRSKYFYRLKGKDNTKSTEDNDPHLFAHVVEELLSRHNTLSHEWHTIKGNPEIVRTSPPDDLEGIDFVMSFSENIACAIDITLAKENSTQGVKKKKRQNDYGAAFEQAPVTFWRSVDGSIGERKFPFLAIHINGPMAANFLNDSASHLDQPLGDAYQDKYKSFFRTLMGTIAEEAKDMTTRMLNNSLERNLFTRDFFDDVVEIIRKPSGTESKTRAILALKKALQDEETRAYFDSIVHYQVIHTAAKVVARQLG